MFGENNGKSDGKSDVIFAVIVTVSGMRIKTTLYLDDNIDARLDARSKQKSMSKSALVAQDFDRFYLCIDKGRKEYESALDNETKHQILFACSQLSGSLARANFLLTGEMHTIKDKKTIEIIKTFSMVARLALLDDSEA